MNYENELDFLKRIFEKCRLQVLILDPYDPEKGKVDLGLRGMLGREDFYGSNFYDELRRAKPNTIYRMTDSYFCSYLFLVLPETKKHTVLVVGPYLAAELSHEQLLEQAELHGVPAGLFNQVEKFYAAVPVVTGENVIFAAIDSFAEKIWGGVDSFTVVDLNQENIQEPAMMFSWEDERHRLEETDWSARTVEARYDYENELMQAVSMGQSHKVEMLMSGFNKLSFERRMADPVRNLKNYCIVMNTILRKAAESGGVHPLYLDRISSDFANKIEALMSIEAVQRLIVDMYTDYCRLVKRHSTGQYSPTVQKTVMHINFGLSGDLSLRTLSEVQNINASYLSTLFRKETGQTITDYVNQKRVYRAERLLSTTKLQIQSIAQHCGISDVNYFSKIFKKYTGKTPKEFRKENQIGQK